MPKQTPDPLDYSERITFVVHKRSMNIENQTKAYVMRRAGHTFNEVRDETLNLEGEKPGLRTLGDLMAKFDRKKGFRKFNYHKCGRKAWKMTPNNKRFVIKRLKELRRKQPICAPGLALFLAKERGVEVSASCMRKVLRDAGPCVALISFLVAFFLGAAS